MRLMTFYKTCMVGILGAPLCFYSGCSGNPDLHFIIESNPHLHHWFESTFQGVEAPVSVYIERAKRKREEKLGHLQETYKEVYTANSGNDTELAEIKSKLDYLENRMRETERSTHQKLSHYEGLKEDLDTLERALEGLRREIIEPNLKAKIKYENARKNYENQ